MSQAKFISCLWTRVSSERTDGQQVAAAATWRNTRTIFSVLRLFTASPHKSGRGKRPHLKTSSHLRKKTTMDSSENTSSHPSRSGGGESYRWVTLPSIGTAVKGCHLVPMKVKSLSHIIVKNSKIFFEDVLPIILYLFKRCRCQWKRTTLVLKREDWQ